MNDKEEKRISVGGFRGSFNTGGISHTRSGNSSQMIGVRAIQDQSIHPARRKVRGPRNRCHVCVPRKDKGGEMVGRGGRPATREVNMWERGDVRRHTFYHGCFPRICRGWRHRLGLGRVWFGGGVGIIVLIFHSIMAMSVLGPASPDSRMAVWIPRGCACAAVAVPGRNCALEWSNPRVGHRTRHGTTRRWPKLVSCCPRVGHRVFKWRNLDKVR